MDWNGWGKLLQDFTKKIALNCVMNWMKPDRCPFFSQLCYIATRWSNLRQCAHQRRCPPLQGVAGAQDLHRKPTNNPWYTSYIYILYIYILFTSVYNPLEFHIITLQKLCRCITLSLQNASCSSFKPVRYPAIQIFQWGAWLTHETNYSCIGAPRIPSACTGLRDSGTEGKSLCLGSTILDLPAMWQNMWGSHWEMPVQTMESHENVEPIRCITSRIIKQIIIKFVCSCNISNFDQFRSIQINSDQFSTSSASPTCQQGWWAAARGSCCIAASRSETVLASHSIFTRAALSTVWCRPRVALLALESNTVKTPVTEDWMLRSLLQRSCRAVEGRTWFNMVQHASTWFNMVQHGWTRSSNLYLGPLMEFPSLTMTRMRLDASRCV